MVKQTVELKDPSTGLKIELREIRGGYRFAGLKICCLNKRLPLLTKGIYARVRRDAETSLKKPKQRVVKKISRQIIDDTMEVALLAKVTVEEKNTVRKPRGLILETYGYKGRIAERGKPKIVAKRQLTRRDLTNLYIAITDFCPEGKVSDGLVERAKREALAYLGFKS